LITPNGYSNTSTLSLAEYGVPLEAIVDKILKDARKQTSRIEGESRAKIQSIETQCKETVRDLLETSRKRAEKLAENQRVKLVSMAELEIRKDLLALKQEMIETAFEGTISKLLEGDEKRYSANQSDRKRIGDDLIREINATLLKVKRKGDLWLSRESRQIRGGVILRRGRKEVNCSVESIIYSKRDELEAKVARVLFPDEKKGE
jgi:V/A-type H+-transporting ATPase subunit E